MAEQQTTALAKADYGTQVIKRMDELTQVGFTVPANYNYINAIKASMLVLADLKDRNGRPALEVCTPVSIQQALFKMAQKGLSAADKTCYFIVRGDQLCCDESYFGKAKQVKRIFPNWEPIPRVIYEGDDFAYETDPNTGRRKLIRHVQTLASLDGNFIGAYMYIPCADGGQDLYVMSRKMIMSAWQKSSNKSLSTHTAFTDKMASKTIVNSGCNMVINSTPELANASDEDDFMQQHTPIDVPAHEVVEIDPDNIPVAEAPSQVKVAQPMSDPKPAQPQPMNPEEQDF